MNRKERKNFLIRVEEKDFVYFRVDAESLGEAKFIASSKDFYKSLNVSQEEAIKNRELPTYKDYEVLAVYECDDEMIEEVSYDYPVWELDEIKNDDEFDSYSEEEKKEMIDWYNSREVA